MNWIELFVHEPFVFLAGAAIFLVLAISGYIFVLSRTIGMRDRLEDVVVGDWPHTPAEHLPELRVVDSALSARARLEAEFRPGEELMDRPLVNWLSDAPRFSNRWWALFYGRDTVRLIDMGAPVMFVVHYATHAAHHALDHLAGIP